jgi:hypothetical protein
LKFLAVKQAIVKKNPVCGIRKLAAGERRHSSQQWDRRIACLPDGE